MTLVVVPLAVVSAGVFGDQAFRDLWRTPKTITTTTCLLLLAGGLTLALGAAAIGADRPVRMRAGRWPDLRPSEITVLEKAGTITFRLTLVGYAAFLVAGVLSGISLAELGAAFGQEGVYESSIKKALGTIPGVTTLTQVGLVSVVISALLLAQRPARRHWIRLVVVLLLSLPRAFLLTERLALLELIVPVAVVLALRLAGAPRLRSAVRIAPVLGLPAVIVVFAAFEYSRSWVFFRERSNGGFAEFAVERFVGYYATALNNGALEMSYNQFPGRWPYQTLGALWTAPGIGELDLWSLLNGGRDNAQAYLDILTEHGTPEFNNSSGLAAPFVDYGIPGGLLYLLGSGIVLGLLHRSFRESSAIGLLVYPILFLGVVELPRYLAWSQGRVFPSIVAAAVIALVMRRAREPEESPDDARPTAAGAAVGLRGIADGAVRRPDGRSPQPAWSQSRTQPPTR
jgi:oligosaccharide repeat unit polymerase